MKGSNLTWNSYCEFRNIQVSGDQIAYHPNLGINVKGDGINNYAWNARQNKTSLILVSSICQPTTAKCDWGGGVITSIDAE